MLAQNYVNFFNLPTLLLYYLNYLPVILGSVCQYEREMALVCVLLAK